MNATALRTSVLAILLCSMIALPLVVRAQESDLQSTIRAALAGDPRTNGMTEAQISAMVSVLSQEAQKQGMAPSDIAWRPVSNAPASDAAACGSMPAFFCSLNMAFGFAGSDHRIPWGLGISSLLLMFIIAALLERHHLHMLALRSAPPAQL